MLPSRLPVLAGKRLGVLVAATAVLCGAMAFQDLYSSHLTHIAPPFASHRATRDNAMALLALHPSPHTVAAIFRACSSLFLVPLTHRIRAALEIFSAHGLPESLFLSQVLHFLFLHLPPPTVAKLLHSTACRVFRTPLPSLLLHLSAMHSIIAPPHSLLFRYPLALRFSPEILKQRLSRLAEIVPLTEAQEGVGGEKGSGGEGEGNAKWSVRGRVRFDSASLLPVPPLDPSLSFAADPAVLSLVRKQPHILHARRETMQEVVTTLTTLFGPQGTSYVLSRHPALLTVSPRTIEDAMFGLIDIFGEEVTLDMIQREPGIIQVRHSTLRPKIDFVLGEMMRSKEDMRVWPNVLLRSLPRMLVPRYFLVTRKDRHAARVLSLPCLFSNSDARFRRRWEVSDADWSKALMVGEVWEARRKEGVLGGANQ
ncbi:unnamed protein product [Closterium sp. NIES-65]|nr:unnamed protein product [Closterium sp. NIES-65]